MVKFITTKRTSKDVTLEQYQAERAKNKRRPQNGQSTTPQKFINVDRRYRYVRPTQKLQSLDVNVAHYINEIRILPYSVEVDNIGIDYFSGSF